MYRVEWLPSAVNDAMAYWLAADSADRRIITTAIDRIDKEPRQDAENAGESRPGDERILFALPVAVLFTINAREAVAHVHATWRVAKRASG